MTPDQLRAISLAVESIADGWFELANAIAAVDEPAPEPPAPEPDPEPEPTPEPPAPEPEPDPLPPPPPPRDHYIWTDVSHLPMEGPAWEQVKRDALADWGTPNISNQDQSHDVMTLAGGLYYARTGDNSVRTKVVDAIAQAMHTERGGRTLALARNLTGYVLAADYIGFRPPTFVEWLSDVRFAELDGRTLVSTQEDRPNNWGTHAGMARIVADLYLGDTTDLTRAVQVFRGYLGDRSAYAGFRYGELSWQADPSNPVGINPKGATKDGHNIDGVLPDDQRRGGSFSWPPPQENYVWEALQGVVATAHVLARNGYPEVWWYSDGAIRRAANWKVFTNLHPPTGDDEFLLPLLNMPHTPPLRHGKSIGYTDWTHGSPEGGDVNRSTLRWLYPLLVHALRRVAL